MYGSFEEEKAKNGGSYVHPEVEKNLSAVKLIAINPNELDEEDALPTTPMLNQRPNATDQIDGDAPEPAGADDDEKGPSSPLGKIKTTSVSAIDSILTNFTGGNDETGGITIDDDDLEADGTLLQASSEGNITLVKKRIEALKHSAEDAFPKDPLKSKEKFLKGLNKVNNTGLSALHLAARYNRKNVINALLDNGAEIDLRKTKDEGEGEGLTPLHLAAKYDMTSAAKFLLDKGARVDLESAYGTTALGFAARRGNIELVDLLLEKNPELVNKGDNSEVTPLHAAMMGGKEEVALALLDHGALINAQDKEGEQPIHYAAAENSEAMILLLVDAVAKQYKKQPDEAKIAKHALVNSVTHESDTPLHIAAQAGYEEVARTLISLGADVNARTDTSETPLHLVCVAGHLNLMRLLIMYKAKINAKDDEQQTALHKAAQFGRLEVCKSLLESGARLDCNDKDNFTPLMLAVWKGQNEIVKFLVDQGASVYVKDMDDKNLLHLAIEEDNDDTLALLFNTPAKRLTDSPDKEFLTPLHYAARFGNVEAIEMLLEKNADVDLTDNYERTPIHEAAEHGMTKCVTLLGEHTPASVNYSEETGKSPLHLAAIKGFKKACSVLIEMGAETSSRDDVNWTPLDYAALHGHRGVVLLLLDNDAPVDAEDKKKSTPLHHAAAHGHTNCIGVLLDWGAEISHVDEDGKNCLDLAVENGQVDACMALIKHDRWKEALKTQDKNGVHPMEKLIAVAPSVAEVVLDKCITKTKFTLPNGTHGTKETYHFEFLDIDPSKQVNDLYFAPANMVRHKQEKLLAHRLTVKLISDKWSRLGHWIYVLSVASYLLYLGLLTALVIKDKERFGEPTRRPSTFAQVGPWLLLLMSLFHMTKEVLQIYYLGVNYFKDVVNYLEIVLYTSTFLFIVPFMAENLDSGIYHRNFAVWQGLKWNAGAVAILLAWGNLLLYLQRFPFFGLYVVMFIEVFKSLISVLPLFSTFIVGFALSFYVLIDGDTGFRHVGRAIFKTSIMMIGEFEFNSIFTENFSKNGVRNAQVIPHPTITYLIFTLFLIVMPILTMNFLVGLAAGDIEAVRKNAYLRILRAQVHILKTIELTYPKRFLSTFYRDKCDDYIGVKFSVFERFTKWWKTPDYDFVIEEQADAGENEHRIMTSLEKNGREIEKQKKRLKNACDVLAEQRERLDYLFEKFGLDEV